MLSTDDEYEGNDEINIEICGKICESKYLIKAHIASDYKLVIKALSNTVM